MSEPESKPLNEIGLSTAQRFLVDLLFEAPFYKDEASLGTEDRDALLEHYLQEGWRKGFDPSSTFQGARHLQAMADLGIENTSVNPFQHYLFETMGEYAVAEAFANLDEGGVARLRANFDADWYRHTYPDLGIAGSDPFIHYMVSGWRASNNPSPRFSTSAYLERYPDIAQCDFNPFHHWILHGRDEGRTGGQAMLPAYSSWESLSDSQQSILVAMFRLDYFRSGQSEVKADRERQIATYVSSGVVEAPTPSFRSSRYAESRHDLLPGQIPFLHYLFAVVGESVLHDLFLTMGEVHVESLCSRFDTSWYLYSNPDVEEAGWDAFIHYMIVGWRENRDPSPHFSTNAYLVRYPDIQASKINPFEHWIVHGLAEGRSGASSSSNFRNRPYRPSVTAILINGKEEPLTPACITAVLRQTYQDLAVMIVGLPLSCPCQSIFDNFAKGEEGKNYTDLTDDRAWSYSRLVRCAVAQTATDLLWVVQGRVVHDADFLERLTSSFADGSVQLGFGRMAPGDDLAIEALRKEVHKEGWQRHMIRPAARWFVDQLRPDTLAAPHHSFVWRRRKLSAEVWGAAEGYRLLGPWYLHLQMASGGQIASVRDALMHVPAASSPTLALGDKADFRSDAIRFARDLQTMWPVSPAALDAFANTPKASASRLAAPATALAAAIGKHNGRSKVERLACHVLLVTHGIFAGGAENFPIQLANQLVERGFIVSMLIFKTDDVNSEMRATLNPGVSIYEADWVLEYGCEKFIDDIGCSLIHSHGVISENFFFQRCDTKLRIPYLATLHGSYEASTREELPESVLAKYVRQVDVFVYTAEKNLKPLLRHNVQKRQLVKMANAMPVDHTPFPSTRAEMGIAEDAVVFTLVARGIREKGWSSAIRCFKAVQKRNPRRSMHLCLVGEGDEPDRLKPLHANDPSISFLGFQLRIHGLYRLTDVAIVPTRFAGESFPLCIIQALQVGVPVIASDVGEIATMLNDRNVTGGVVVRSSRFDALFEMRFAAAMHSLVDNRRREQLRAGAVKLGSGYDMSELTNQYVALYNDALDGCSDNSLMTAG
jgi:glycosyltransferase involved in cell wall biosynthesis